MDEKRDLQLEIAQLIGSPINVQLPVPVEMSAIADFSKVAAGEHVWRIQNLDLTADVILDVDSNGVITVIKRTPGSDVELTFKGLNSKLEYVLVDDVLNSADQTTLARRKASISRGMDKTELKLVLDAMLTPTSTYYPANKQSNLNDVAAVSADDLYDVIISHKQSIEDYGDSFLLLAGKDVKNAIETYDKDNATDFNYNVTLEDRLVKAGIKVMKIFGQVSNTDNEVALDLLDAKTFILVAQNSRIVDGKPVQFVRRIISPEIAKLMGATVDSLERAVIVNPTPVQAVVSGTRQSLLAYGVYGYESVIFAITNPYALASCDCSAIL